MKNVLIYISPTKSFNNPHPNPNLLNDAGVSVKVQIENSLRLGWKVEDILLYTNFEFQYGVVKATVLPDVEFFEPDPRANKINPIVKLFEKELINGRELYWFHDLDAFQLYPITESELKLGKADMALADYRPLLNQWSTITIFFKKSSRDIFYKIKKIRDRNKIYEEMAIQELIDNDKSIRKRIKKLNKTYKFAPHNRLSCYQKAIRPIRIVHFHPRSGIPKLDITRNVPLLPDRLIKIFHYHRIR